MLRTQTFALYLEGSEELLSARGGGSHGGRRGLGGGGCRTGPGRRSGRSRTEVGQLGGAQDVGLSGGGGLGSRAALGRHFGARSFPTNFAGALWGSWVAQGGDVARPWVPAVGGALSLGQDWPFLHIKNPARTSFFQNGRKQM